jgi:hypothetical protein
MKRLIFTTITAIFLASCGSSVFYQIYKVDPISSLLKNDESLVYENENCKILYNFWGQGGNAGFYFYNKTDENIYINMEESFFICNGFAFDYYKNRTFTHSQNFSLNSSSSQIVNTNAILDIGWLFASAETKSTTAKSQNMSSGASISHNEKNIICIPPKSTKIIAEYNITESLYRDCNLFLHPSKKRIKTSEFSESDSPFVFSNKIAYAVGQSENLLRFENKFHVSEITNYPQEEVIETKYEDYCGEKSGRLIEYFKNASPDKFYIQYSKGKTSFKH